MPQPAVSNRSNQHHYSITSSARHKEPEVGTVEAERLSGLQVDDELELGRLIDRQVGGLFALENPSDVKCIASIPVLQCRYHSSSSPPSAINSRLEYIGRDGVTRRQRDNLLAPAGKERIGADKERAGALLPQGSEGGVNLARARWH